MENFFAICSKSRPAVPLCAPPPKWFCGGLFLTENLTANKINATVSDVVQKKTITKSCNNF